MKCIIYCMHICDNWNTLFIKVSYTRLYSGTLEYISNSYLIQYKKKLKFTTIAGKTIKFVNSSKFANMRNFKSPIKQYKEDLTDKFSN